MGMSRLLCRAGAIAALLSGLWGCAAATQPDGGTDPRARALQALANSPTCCAALENLPFRELAEGEVSVRIDERAPSYRFDSGKSFFVAYRLPRQWPSFELEVRSLVGDTLLAPSALLLDATFRVTRRLGAETFAYRPARGFKGDSIDGSLRIDRSQPGNPGNETYLVLFTTGQQLRQQTTLVHPAKAYALAHGNQPPAIADPVIPHSPTGVLKLRLTRDGADEAGGYIPARSKQGLMGGSESVSDDAVPGVLPETEAFYRDALDRALDAGDLDRALKLVEEGRRLGIDGLRTRFLQRVQPRRR